MKRVDTLVSGGTVVTMNQAMDIFVDGALAIHQNKIVAVGDREDILSQYESDDVVSAEGQYILPGLVNAHTHLPMTLLRGLADDLRLDVWLMGYIMPTEREFVSPEFCRLGTLLACAESIRSGVTCFADMYYYESEIAQAVADVGLRGVLGQTILKFPAPDADSYEESLEYARTYIEKWRGHPLITPAVAPHAPYSSTEELLKKSAQLAMQYDIPVLMHISETKQEEEDNVRDYEMRVIPWVKTTGLLNAKVLAAHCVHINAGDIAMMYENDTSVSHNPSSNLKLASGVAPVKAMLDKGLNVGIGTDGPASNNDLDMFEEIRLAAFLAKTANNDPTVLPAKQALLMATRMGAEALFLGDVTGSLEVGKFADMLIMDADTIHNSPKFNRSPDLVYSQIVYAGKSSDVAHVMCHGKWMMRDRVLLTINLEEVTQQARDYAEKVDKFLLVHENDVISKLVAVGGLEQTESFEVQVKARLTDASAIEELLDHPDVEVLRTVHYRQYDTYFTFIDENKGRVRYREDCKLDDRGEISEVRARLTFTMPEKEREFNSAVLLSHSRFIAPADRPLRFYQEYFHDSTQRELQKERRRWRIHYQGVLFFVNIDRVLKPNLDELFIEIKSRTWSLSDAEVKAERIRNMMEIMGISPDAAVSLDYLEMQPQPD
ncbi:MAG: amidohydrolase family protein [Aggregatilineales bacterium]